jgi:RNA polymerase sigma-70 factor (sigma-E family)
MTFEEFAQTQLPAMLAFATALTGQRATADDLAQEVLIRVLARWDRIGRVDRPDLYVRKMLLNEFLSSRRRSWRLIPAGDAVPRDAGTPDPAAEYAEHDAMLAEIGRLPRSQRAVLALRYYEDRTDAEIADLLGWRPSTVRVYAARALAALRVDRQLKRPEKASLARHQGKGL